MTSTGQRGEIMEDIILEVKERNQKTGKFKEVGFVPGVLYGDSITGATSVKFDALALRKVINTHGANAKIWIHNNNNKQYGFIKEVQRHPISRQVSHIDVQIVSKDHEIQLNIPLTFKGEEELKAKQLQLQVYKSDVTVFGKMALMADGITIDVSSMQLGDAINFKSLNLDSQLKSEEETVYGMIVHMKSQPVEEVVETKTQV